MRIPRIVAGYMAREIVQYSVLGFLVFASLMLTQNLLRTLTNLSAVTGAASVWDLSRVLGYLLPTLATYALPAAFLFGVLLAVPLGLRRVRGARSACALICVALAFGYYMLLSLAEVLAEETGIPPAIALWLPNAAFLAVAIPLLNRARRGEG